MNIILITSGQRPELLYQSMRTLRDNASTWSDHTLTIVYDGIAPIIMPQIPGPTIIHNTKQQGASASRNIGAGSIPGYRRQEHVFFVDDDIWASPGWDAELIKASAILPKHLIAPYGHPYNVAEIRNITIARFPLLVSSVAVLMQWTAFDEIGWWLEPGGPSGSEDFEFCGRARQLGYGFAVLHPQRFIHTGIVSSTGKHIVGKKELDLQNYYLEKLYGVVGAIAY